MVLHSRSTAKWPRVHSCHFPTMHQAESDRLLRLPFKVVQLDMQPRRRFSTRITLDTNITVSNSNWLANELLGLTVRAADESGDLLDRGTSRDG